MRKIECPRPLPTHLTGLHAAQWLVRCASSSAARALPVPFRITSNLDVRLVFANKRKLKPFANVPGIRSLGNELSSEPLHKQKYLFPDGVDKHQVRKIDN